MSYPLAIVAMDMLIAGEAGLPHFDQAIYDGQSLVKTNAAISAKEFESFLANLISGAEEECEAVALYIFGKEQHYPQPLVENLKDSFKSVAFVAVLADAISEAREQLASNSEKVVAIAALSEAITTEQGANTGAVNDVITTLKFDSKVTTEQHYSKNHAAAAFVLANDCTSMSSSTRNPYAYVLGSAYAPDVPTACMQSFNHAEVETHEVEYIDVVDFAGQLTQSTQLQSEQVLTGLAEVYGRGGHELECALGSVNTCLGDCGYVTGIASIIKSAMCLYHRYIPMVPNWDSPSQPQVWDNSPFYVATDSTPWFENKALGIRKAAVNLVTPAGATHIILSENRDDKTRSNTYFSRVSWCFYPIAGNNREELVALLEALKRQLAIRSDVKTLAKEYYQKFELARKKASYTLVILGENTDILSKEVDLMLDGLQSAFDNGLERKTPKGSFFTPTPVGSDAEVAFVYPGIGAPYVDFGRDLFHLFPAAYSSLDQMSRDAGKSVKQELLYPRSRYRLDAKQKKQVEKELKVNLHKISECGVGMGYLLTKAFRDQFNLQPNAGVGYSMGEISMYVALDAWKDPGCLSDPLADHPTFKHNITGELFALKEFWNIPNSEVTGAKLWNTYSLRGNPEEVAKAVEQEEKVYLTIINTPDNMLIGGDPEGCQRVVKALGTRAMSLELASAIHSAPAKLEYDRIMELYSIDVNERSNVRYYSTSVYKPVPHRSKAIAHSIAKSFTEQVNFPLLIEKMVDSGVRVFVEMGADRSCSTWIDKILKHNHSDMPHVCVPVNARGTDDHITVIRALAKLVSHQVNIDISSLFVGQSIYSSNMES